MNWLTNFIRPKIQSIVEQKDVPDNLWQKCPGCDGMLFHRDLADNMNVCYHCGHHMKITVQQRIELLFDNARYKELPIPKVPHDPLKFKDRKRYADRLKETKAKTGREDAIMIAEGTIGGSPAIIAAMDFAFMGGSMGAAVGEAIVSAAERAVSTKSALIVIPTSGGARMQEGMVSLMQMPRTIIAAEMVKNEGLPYIVLLTDPTTGGVSASFAMVGDIHIAEPGTTIGFAGKRVIQETIREELPPGFQTAEYLKDHGMVDMVVPRKELHDTLARILDLLFNTKGSSRAADGGTAGNSGKSNGKAKNTRIPKAKGAKAALSVTKIGKTGHTPKDAANISEPQAKPKRAAAAKN